MFHPKIVIASTIQVFFLSFLASHFDLQLSSKAIGLLRAWIPGGHNTAKKTVRDSDNLSSSQPKIFTPRELAKYNGEKGSKGLYLAVLGRVYDVQKGKRHYGPNGGYHFFAGRDATRAFVTGEFTEGGLVDDVSGLSHQDLLGIQEWLQFYDKEYKFIGYLNGRYYDSKGNVLPELEETLEAVKAAEQWKEGQQAEAERFPPCNSEWSQNKGGRVWCTNKSGGIRRDWVGVPRKLFKPGSAQSRCACVRNNGTPTDPDAPDNHRGDLDHPNLQEYKGCDPTAISCQLDKD